MPVGVEQASADMSGLSVSDSRPTQAPQSSMAHTTAPDRPTPPSAPAAAPPAAASAAAPASSAAADMDEDMDEEDEHRQEQLDRIQTQLDKADNRHALRVLNVWSGFPSAVL